MTTGTAIDVTMPQMGVSVSEGTVTKWLKNVGDTVAADEGLLEISTDKVDTEVPSPGAGVLQEILVQEGETVAVGSVLARLGSEAAIPPAPPTPSLPAPDAAMEPLEPEPLEPEPLEPEPLEPEPLEPEPLEPEAIGEDDDEDAGPAAPAATTAPAAEPSGNGHSETHGFVSPVVARIAAEHGIDTRLVPGTGRGGRVTKKDILAVVESGSQPAVLPTQPLTTQPLTTQPLSTQPPPVPPPATPVEEAPAPAASPALATAPGSPAPPTPAARPAAPAAGVEPGETVEPLSTMRRGIAEHMRRSLDTAAHVTSAIEVDMSNVARIRESLKKEYTAAYGVNPTYLAFVSRAVVDTLKDWPWVNAELRGESVITRNYVNLGFAVALEGGKGLIVPVLKHAEGLNLLGMARGIADLAERARTKRLLPDDVQGGTFTITNPGSFGTFMGTPIISQPQSGILGTYAIVKRPWVIQDDAGQDAIAIRPMMNLTLTYDHRLVDGAYGAQFLRDLAQRLQSWGEADY